MGPTRARAYTILAAGLYLGPYAGLWGCRGSSAVDAGASAADAAVAEDAAAPDAAPSIADAEPAEDARAPLPPGVPARADEAPTIGDMNGDGILDIADAVAISNYVYRDGPSPVCASVADFDRDGTVDPGDSYRITTYLVTGEQQRRALPIGACMDTTPREPIEPVPLAVHLTAPARVSTARFTAQLSLESPVRAVEAWSMSVVATDCTITEATTAGTIAAEVWDDPPGLRHLGYSGTFVVERGAVTYVILSQLEDVTLPVRDGAQPVLALSVTAEVPATGCRTCTLATSDGLVWRGRPIEPVVVIDGRALVPPPASTTVEVCAP